MRRRRGRCISAEPLAGALAAQPRAAGGVEAGAVRGAAGAAGGVGGGAGDRGAAVLAARLLADSPLARAQARRVVRGRARGLRLRRFGVEMAENLLVGVVVEWEGVARLPNRRDHAWNPAATRRSIRDRREKSAGGSITLTAPIIAIGEVLRMKGSNCSKQRSWKN